MRSYHALLVSYLFSDFLGVPLCSLCCVLSHLPGVVVRTAPRGEHVVEGTRLNLGAQLALDQQGEPASYKSGPVFVEKLLRGTQGFSTWCNQPPRPRPPPPQQIEGGT